MRTILILLLFVAISLYGQEDPETREKLEILKKYRNKNKQQKILLLRFLQENKRIQLETRISEIEFQLETGIPKKIWERCWNEKEEYFDFTNDVWRNLSHSKQVKYARKYQEWYAEKLGKPVEQKMQVGKTKMIMVLIPPGKFWMGSPKNEQKRNLNEQQHKVLISKGFWIGKYEVTQKQWREVMGDNKNPSHFKNAGEDAPVEKVSWDNCRDFCKNTGLSLPTEAQWEYACRAGTQGMSYIGDFEIKDKNAPKLGMIAWYAGNSNGTNAVGMKPSNSWKLHDMHGNVWEWCYDQHDPEYYKKLGNEVTKDPKGPDGFKNRCLRGGSWINDAETLRAANRGCNSPDVHDYTFGFRCALTLENN